MIERGKHQPVNVIERQSLRGFAPQHVELVTKDQDLGFQRSPRPEQSGQGAPDQPAKIAHQGEYQPIRSRGQQFWVCGRDREATLREPMHLKHITRAHAATCSIAGVPATEHTD